MTAIIDHEVQQIIDNAHEIAQSVLRLNRSLLEEVAQKLLDDEVLEGETLQKFLKRAKSPVEMAGWLQSGQIQTESVQDIGS